jgi:trehalose 6-phosphate phosphatase
MTDTQAPAADQAATAALFEEAGPFALFLDFDGTLVDIAARPDAVRVAEHLPAMLARLRDRLGGALAIVSGRPIAVLDSYLAPFSFDAAGLHGAEQRIGGVVQVDETSDPARLRPLAAELRTFAGAHPGVILEDKGRSLALHWRQAPAAAEAAIEAMLQASRVVGRDYRLQEGKNVVELLPRWATKGAAISRFLDEEIYRHRRPVFVGDDATDEHGFEVVEQRGGIAIRVGQGPSLASRRLRDPADLHELLSALDTAPHEKHGADSLHAPNRFTLQDRS